MHQIHVLYIAVKAKEGRVKIFQSLSLPLSLLILNKRKKTDF